jgi:hypothetical protein
MFTQDTRTETFLSQIGVKYRFADDLKIKDLATGWDVINRGRPVALRESAVLEYGCLMEAGSPAPAVIVHEGTLAVLDGLQRLAAAREVGFTRFAAYVVESDSADTLLAIRVLANARLQGHAETPEWTKRNAVQHLILDRNMSPEEVAALGGWKPADLKRLAKLLDWGFQIRCIGGPQSLPDGIVCQIAELTTQDELRRAQKPIAAFLHSLVKGRFATRDAEPYIQEFFRPAAKVTVYDARLAEFLDTPEVDTRLHGRMGPGLSTDINLRRSLRTAVSILDRTIEEGEDLRYVDEFFQLTKKITVRLRKLAPHCKAANIPPTPADKWT